MIIEELKSHLPHHINLIAINIAVHALTAVILALHYAVKQGHKGSVKTVLDASHLSRGSTFCLQKIKRMKVVRLPFSGLLLMSVKR